jgi:hypothetical protein
MAADWLRAQFHEQRLGMEDTIKQHEDSEAQFSQDGYSIDIGSGGTPQWKGLIDHLYQTMSFEDLMETSQPSVQIHRPLASEAKYNQGILQPSIMQATK